MGNSKQKNTVEIPILNRAPKQEYEKAIRIYNAGFVLYHDHYGSDLTPLISARMSTLSETGVDDKKDAGTRGYLWRKGHCYHEDMEVLTSSGWKKWKETGTIEEFLVPDPKTKKLNKEILSVIKEQYSGELCTFENNRMSYKVTPEHRMWFKSRSKDSEFQIYKAKDVQNGGHYEPLVEYETLPTASDKFFEMVGFYLGDGHWQSENTIRFRLKKDRKIDYIIGVLKDLGAEFKIRVDKYNVTNITTKIDDKFKNIVSRDTTFDKQLLINISTISQEQIYGLFLGMVNSDGSVRKDRHGTSFMTRSDMLNKLFESCGSVLGLDSHKVWQNKTLNTYRIMSYDKQSRTSLESRLEYKNKEDYTGNVYCATTSTGLLIVRGKETDYGFVCGNSSPFEQAGLTVVLQVPIAIARQLMRHRSMHFNEFSMRYSEPMHEYYIPEPEAICYDNEFNKQSSGQPVKKELADQYLNDANSDVILNKARYEKYRKLGIAKERVRDFQPVSAYTRVMCTANLRDWYFFLNKRLKMDAQLEIRLMSQAIYEMLKDLFPLCSGVFEEFTLNAENISAKELQTITSLINSLYLNEEEFNVVCGRNNLNKSLTRELKQKLKLRFN